MICLLGSSPNLMAENLTITLKADDYQIISRNESYQAIEMQGYSPMLIPGKPALPAKIFSIGLPPGAEVVSVSATGEELLEIPGIYNIEPAPPYMPANNDKTMAEKCMQEWRENFDKTYSSDNGYPESVTQYLGTAGLRKYNFARVAYFPFSYHPVSGRLVFSPAITISIEYSLLSAGSMETEKILADTKADKLASELLVNYDQARQWYMPETAADSPDSLWYNYIIITTDALTGAVVPLVNWKEMLGFYVNVVTTTWINTYYSDPDLQARIRHFLTDYYTEWSIEYVLLVGNIDVIPMRHCFPDPSNHSAGSDYNPPTDYYYADLTGNWDSDGDGYFGEYGQDNVDFYAEVYVGRIPYSDSASVAKICQKLVNFESDTGPWKDNALLLGAISNYANEDYSGWMKTDGAYLMLDMISYVVGGWTYMTMYEKQGFEPSPFACDYDLSWGNVITQWISNDFGIVNWWAHGGAGDAWRKWWAWDDGDNVPEEDGPDEMGWQAFCKNTDESALDDDHPSIVFSCSCNNAWPEQDNLARRLIYKGSAGIVASTRISWYTIGWDYYNGGNASIDYEFFDYMINDPMPVGDALFASKIFHLNNYFWWGWQSQANLFDFVLYGDPAMVREGVLAYACGDVNGDGSVDMLDILDLINYLYKGGPPPASTESADVNNDGSIDMLDILYLINYLYKGGGAPTC
jgi:hypothetical protein